MALLRFRGVFYMRSFDCVIIGFGISGLAMARELDMRNQHCLVVDAGNQAATRVAGGTLHAAVLGQYRKVWRGAVFWDYAQRWYSALGRDLNNSLIQTRGLIKRFHSAQDRETWTAMRDKKDEFWSEYLNPVNDQFKENLNLNLPFGYGTSDQFWRYDPCLLLDAFLDRLKAKGQYLSLSLEVNSQDELFTAIKDLDIGAKTIVLAQGHQQRIWPSFPSGNPVQPKQGEYVIIECPDLELNRVLKSKFFIIPLGGGRYQVGATYWQKRHETTPEETREKLLSDIESVINLPYQVIEYRSGIRPGTKDRKPILGAINAERGLYTINGLNSRGLLMAPLLASWLADHLLDQKALPSEVSIDRFF